MPKVTLKCLDDAAQKVVEIPMGRTTIGRGLFLMCADRRVSRNHAVLEVTDKGEVFLTPTHVNPCFFPPTADSIGTILKKDKPQKLEHCDSFSFLPKAFRYEVIITDEVTSTITENGSQKSNDKSEERVNENSEENKNPEKNEAEEETTSINLEENSKEVLVITNEDSSKSQKCKEEEKEAKVVEIDKEPDAECNRGNIEESSPLKMAASGSSSQSTDTPPAPGLLKRPNENDESATSTKRVRFNVCEKSSASTHLHCHRCNGVVDSNKFNRIAKIAFLRARETIINAIRENNSAGLEKTMQPKLDRKSYVEDMEHYTLEIMDRVRRFINRIFDVRKDKIELDPCVKVNSELSQEASANIEKLKKELCEMTVKNQELEMTVKEKDSKIKQLESQVTSLTSENSSLQSDVTTQTSSQDAIQTKLDPTKTPLIGSAMPEKMPATVIEERHRQAIELINFLKLEMDELESRSQGRSQEEEHKKLLEEYSQLKKEVELWHTKVVELEDKLKIKQHANPGNSMAQGLVTVDSQLNTTE